MNMDNSPFSLLPSELVSKIFEDCLAGGKPSFNPRDAPLLLTHICRTWRTIASSTPHLWSHILVPRWQFAPAGVDELLNLWLSRSGISPLNIDIGLFDQGTRQACGTQKHRDDAVTPVLRRLLALLAPHRARIRTLWGVFPPSLTHDVGVSDLVNAERIFYYGTPKRILLNSTRFGDDVVLPADDELDLGSTKPTLRILSVCDCNVNVDSVLLQTGLTHLELFDLHTSTSLCQETAFELLRSLPNLQKCVLELTRHERLSWDGQPQRLNLPNMELLFLLWDFPADIGILLNSLYTPNLIRLGVRGTPTVGTQRSCWSALHDFIRASQPPLARLSLGDMADVDICLLDSLICCPDLVHLSLNHCIIPDDLLYALTCTDPYWKSHSPVLPRLEVLNIVTCAGLKPRSLYFFLRSRTEKCVLPPGISRLREVEISNCFGITKDDAPLLQECNVEKFILRDAKEVLIMRV